MWVPALAGARGCVALAAALFGGPGQPGEGGTTGIPLHEDRDGSGQPGEGGTTGNPLHEDGGGSGHPGDAQAVRGGSTGRACGQRPRWRR